jgi:geranylgeranylglycerol-phosphate geranylgeranyltransferase
MDCIARMQLIAARAQAIGQLLRPLNMVMFLAGVVVGGVLSAGAAAFVGVSASHLAVAAVSAALVGGAANSLNDVFDVDVDRLNRPERPLPSGRLSVGAAWGVWALGSAGGLVLAGMLSLAHLAMAGGAVVLLATYSVWFKRLPGVGNAVVAGVVALSLVYGGWAIGGAVVTLPGATFAFLTTLAREVTKDIEDVAGDAVVRSRTLPLVGGLDAAARTVAGVLAVAVALTPVPYLALSYGGLYLLGVLVADLLMLRALGLLLHNPARHARSASGLLKGAMLVGLAALALA